MSVSHNERERRETERRTLDKASNELTSKTKNERKTASEYVNTVTSGEERGRPG